ncbi:acid phosphatase pho5 [Aspergillus wentii]|nr:acid phosphatase pho5 [Aspergillus wentii]
MVVLHSTLTAALCLFAATSATASSGQIPLSFNDDTPDYQEFSHGRKQFSQKFLDGYSFLKHYGGLGPYSDRESYGIDRDTPAGCEVDQVIMIKRHGERFPTTNTGKSMAKTLRKLDAIDVSSRDGDLAFLKHWTYYVPSECYLNAETTTGPYAGLRDAFKHGKQYRKRYGHLWDGQLTVPIFAGDYPRVIDTAHVFGEGFFGHHAYKTKAAMNIISEDVSQGADSLTPGCPSGNKDHPCSRKYLLPQFDVAADRLNFQYENLNLTAADIQNLMSVAAFELNARPSSPWVDVFTLDEWSTGSLTLLSPGNDYMSAVGSVYVNASLTLLNQGPSAGRLSFNFAHDTNIVPIVTALGLATPTEHLPVDRIPFGNPFSIGNIVPMGGHLTIERLTCDATPISSAGTYVRLVLNEAVVPFHFCQSGPGYSCPLDEYTSILSESLPNYVDKCGIPESDPQYLDFWWNYSDSNKDNFLNKTQPCP